MSLNDIKDLELKNINNKDLFNQLFYMATTLLDSNDFDQYMKVMNYIYNKQIKNKGD